MLHISLYFLALVSLSTSSNWAKLNHMPSVTLGFYRLIGAFSLLLVYLFVTKKLQKIKFDRFFAWALASSVFFFLHLWTFKYASKNTLIANTVILFATNPVWATLGGQVFFKENIKFRTVVSYFLALIGVFILVGQNLKLTDENHLGNVSALVSAFLYAAYILTSKKARVHMDNFDYSLVQYFTAGALFGICMLATGAQNSGFDATSWWAVVALILIPTFIGHMGFTFLVKHMNLSLMSCGKLIEPVIATILAYFMFDEQLGSNAIYAFILTGLSVLILFWPSLFKNDRIVSHENPRH